MTSATRISRLVTLKVLELVLSNGSQGQPVFGAVPWHARCFRRCEGEECIGAQEPPKRLAHPNVVVNEITGVCRDGDVCFLELGKPPGMMEHVLQFP